ncbi:GAF domain-containing sensor histidine kinase [Nocardia sp. NBC_01730]|uniref:GAF domain-containing sensor histidine kinase n=1 Tax=Nocardia sp. NBC_01730 TaxID=2975998 RepID=UPI002E130A90
MIATKGGLRHTDSGLVRDAGPDWLRRLVSLSLRPTTPPFWLGFTVAATFIAVQSVLVVWLKQFSPGDAFGVVYLLGVLVVSTIWGLGMAVATSLASAIAFDYFRNWPTPFVPGADDLAAIAVFLVVALLANTLADLARTHAIEADRRRAEADQVADQQAALRRVATLVARGATSSEVFSAVTEESTRCLGVSSATLFRYDPDGSGTIVARRDEPGLQKPPVGERLTLDGENISAMVLRTGSPARLDSHDHASGSAAARIREFGLRAGVGASIVVDGRLWGVIVAGTSRREPLPADIKARLAEFADLVATAIAKAEAHAQLTASRARIVAATDEARRRLERDLHDGAQQRLVSLGLMLRTAEAMVPSGSTALRARLSDVVQGLVDVSEDLREISRGIHPAILSKGGLGPALKALARRSAVPVRLDAALHERLPESAEIAAYYVAAEALTNATKHAQASGVEIDVRTEGPYLQLSIRDDGIGGADPAGGSGLIGLTDRVEALGGRLDITSHPGHGTTLLVRIPIATTSATIS